MRGAALKAPLVNPGSADDGELREIVDAIPHKTWYSGSRGGVLYLNARFFEYTGMAHEQAVGMGWCAAVYPDDLPICFDFGARQTAAENHAAWVFEYRIRRHDGAYRWHVGRTVPLYDATGAVRRWVGTATDIQDEKDAALRQRRFLREVLASVTEGRLRLCDSEAEFPAPLAHMPTTSAPIPLSRESLSVFRRAVSEACARACLPPERAADLVIAAGEAAMNVVVHGGGGDGWIYARNGKRGAVQVWTADQGTGIGEETIHRATLEPGFSSAGSLGQGFSLMLRTADRIYLRTGSNGTSVVIEQHAAPKSF